MPKHWPPDGNTLAAHKWLPVELPNCKKAVRIAAKLSRANHVGLPFQGDRQQRRQYRGGHQ